jgi:hypothetical protein
MAACGTFQPKPFDETLYLRHAIVRTDGDITVTADVLTPQEGKEVLGGNPAAMGIQPVWLRIENKGKRPYWFLPHRLDPEYYSALEVANMLHGSGSKKPNKSIYDYFYEEQMARYIPSGETRSGFVFTNYERGMKHLAIKLIGENSVKRFYLAFEIPGPRMDYQKVDFERLYKAEEIVELDLAGLRQRLEFLACCTASSQGKDFADPLNLVIVGDRTLVMAALLGRGWSLTETIRAGSVYKMIFSSLFGVRYRTAPISPLYWQGRPQDFAMQKTRSNVNRRNHLRLWLSSMTTDGKPVWVGQISRDIGIKFTTKSPYLVTHEISSNIDEARHYITEDLVASNAVQKIGYVRGMEQVTRSAPRQNLTGDDYFTDGLRVVLFLEDRYTPLDQIKLLDWETPADRW